IWFRRSRAGLAVQAVAENERAAAFARLSPNTLGMLTWTLAGVFSTLILVLAGPAIGVLNPTNLTLLAVPALAGALIARLSSVWVGVIGALALGVLNSESQFMSQTKAWWPSWAKQGLTDAMPFVVVVVVLFFLGRSIPQRGDDNRSSLPPVLLPKNRPAVILLLSVGGVLALVLTTGTYRFGVITSLIDALIALSLVVLTGMLGQISLAQAAFAGVAGLTVAKFGTHVPFPLSLLLAALVAAVVGVIVGLPALRIRGAQLAVVTLAAALALESFVFNNPAIVSSTSDLISDPKLFGWNLGIRDSGNIARLQFGFLVLAVVIIMFVLIANITRAGTGRKMIAVRSNERAAASIGINVAGIKLQTFGLSSFIAGLGGALIGYSQGQVSAASFSALIGLGLLAIAYVGGIASLSGAFIAGALSSVGIAFVFLNSKLSLGNYYPLLTGLALVVTVVLSPIGAAGQGRELWARVSQRKSSRQVPTPASTEGESVAPERLRPAPTRVQRTIGDLLLRTEGITVSYGGLTAVDGVSIEVRAGEIVGLIGPNGAGKTTFIDAITGFAPSSGDVYLKGEKVSDLPAYRRARRGLVRSWQSGELFGDLSVESNVRVADDVGRDLRRLFIDMIRPNPAPSAAVSSAMRLMALDDVAQRKPGQLSLGRQKTLGVARSLALDPSVLLLDEPAAGLDSIESLEFGADLQRIAGTGVGCLLIDHDMNLVLGMCDRVYVIEFGKQIAHGAPDEVRRDPKVVAAYLGSSSIDEITDDLQEPARAPSVGDPVPATPGPVTS
ncbi:MAG: ATP-binding cassette domain-containing protein, partial [Actinomycetota bacterium]|nr:ATP-binding cassette domain-containing protein [Actinomycetota bacterium]